jgi:hypothetical protein
MKLNYLFKMKAIITLFFITLLSISSCTSMIRPDRDTNSNSTTEGIFVAVEAFFNKVGLDTFDDFFAKLVKDAHTVHHLIEDIVEFYKNSRKNWVDTADTISKVGRLLDVIAGSIRENANNTRLNQQLDRVLNNINDITKNPRVFFENVKKNIEINALTLGWEIYDLYNLAKAGDFEELGKRAANVFLTIFSGTIPPRRRSSLRLLALKKNLSFEGLSLKLVDCARQVINRVNELIKRNSADGDVTFHVLMDAVYDIYQIITNCNAQ